MTFSISIYAANKAAATTAIAAATAPQAVKDFLTAAVASIADDPVMQVSASGHLHAGENDTEISTLSATVTPLRSV